MNNLHMHSSVLHRLWSGDCLPKLRQVKCYPAHTGGHTAGWLAAGRVLNLQHLPQHAFMPHSPVCSALPC